MFMADPNGAASGTALSCTANSDTRISSAHTNNIINPEKPESPADAGGRKPRDARLIHLMLANQGVTAYQERVPLMLMDFAYRAPITYYLP